MNRSLLSRLYENCESDLYTTLPHYKTLVRYMIGYGCWNDSLWNSVDAQDTQRDWVDHYE